MRPPGDASVAPSTLAATIRLMPAGDPPHKGPTAADGTARAQMLQLALDDEAGLCVDTRELDRPGPSYTVDTLHALREQVGSEQPWAILVGADSFLSLHRWHRWRELFALAHIVVAERPGSRIDAQLPDEVGGETATRWAADAQALHAAPAGLVFALRQPLYPQSASEIRRRIAAGEPWRDQVAPAVADYIVRHGLYS